VRVCDNVRVCLRELSKPFYVSRVRVTLMSVQQCKEVNAILHCGLVMMSCL
jgi:hypothetical protein